MTSLKRAALIATIGAALGAAPLTVAAFDLSQALTGAAAGAGVINDSDKAAIDQTATAVAKSFEDITPEQEYYIGRAVAASLLGTRKAYDDKAATDYLNLLGRTLSLFSLKPETFGGYHFLIIDSSEINAFAAPGGLILVTRGLLRCATSEDTVAAILAHEIGHVAKQHGLKAIKKDRLTKAVIGVGTTAAQVLGPEELKQQTSLFKDSVGDITGTLVNSGYSRDLEFDADKSALAILKAVGYDPRALEDMLKIMQTKLAPGGHDFAKTHPDPKLRIDAIEKALKGSKPIVVAPDAQAARQARYKAALGNI
jgi:beta-barrel assembly-enhancing protease